MPGEHTAGPSEPDPGPDSGQQSRRTRAVRIARRIYLVALGVAIVWLASDAA